jgi:hypothetical protein
MGGRKKHETGQPISLPNEVETNCAASALLMKTYGGVETRHSTKMSGQLYASVALTTLP